MYRVYLRNGGKLHCIHTEDFASPRAALEGVKAMLRAEGIPESVIQRVMVSC